MRKKINKVEELIIQDQFISLIEIIKIAEDKVSVKLSEDTEYCDHLQRGSDYVNNIIQGNNPVYGINTGFGDSCDVLIPPDQVFLVSNNLYTYHGCGLGEPFKQHQVRAIIAVRLISLSKGFSGVRPILLKGLVDLLAHNIHPVIPSEGSVGASGDLTPLSYLAAVLSGEREVYFRNQRIPTSKAFAIAKINPLHLAPKEGLAIMNGTAVMTALACEAWVKADYLMKLSARITAMAIYALDGNVSHFDAFLFHLKPHLGPQKIAQWIRQDLSSKNKENTGRIQERYSIRCAPHVIGVLADALGWMKKDIENEINSVNDNPVIDPDNMRVMHGGHFYGGHIAFVMDSLKNLVANLADLMDRQLALLVDYRYSNGLTSNLSLSVDPSRSVNHGLKALQISVSAWTAEALKLTIPASVFSRSTECHNQDKVSMGTISSRDCLRVITLTEQVASAMLIATFQGVTIRSHLATTDLPPSRAIENMMDDLSQVIQPSQHDRFLQPELEQLMELIQSRHWSLYAEHDESFTLN